MPSSHESVSGIKHPAFRDALALTRQPGRAETGRYLVEDENLVRQALAHPNTEIYAVFANNAAAARLGESCAARHAPLYILGSGLMTRLIGTGYETAVEAVAIALQRIVPPETLLTGDALILAGERIQDPRNVGVLVRTAEAAGCTGLLLSGDSAEPFSRAAVRSTTGSILRLPLAIAENLPKTLTDLRERGARIIATSARAENLVYDAPLAVRPLVLIVGNETEGISAAARATATDFVRLPMAGGASSLNVTVAAGALLYEAIRQRIGSQPREELEEISRKDA